MRWDESLAQARDSGEFAGQEEAGKITTAVLEVLSERITPSQNGGRGRTAARAAAGTADRRRRAAGGEPGRSATA